MSILQMRMPSRRFSDRIRSIGFRKWYERELLSSHAHLVLCILSIVAMLASFEAIRGASSAQKAMNMLFVVLSGGIALWSLRRFLFLNLRAEGVANQASCADCGEYGRFSVVGDDRDPDNTQVCCKKCAHQWIISQ